MKGIITSLQRLSIHDGSGIRTVAFLKGCNMRCKWCHNPETWSFHRQLQYLADKCIGCGTCASLCPAGALQCTSNKVLADYTKCNSCGICAAHCCTNAISLVGREISTEDLFSEIQKDIPYFRQSGGGVTLSGGEPLLQADFAVEFLSICRKNQISTAIESNFSVQWDIISRLLPLTDFWMCDLKTADDAKHRYWTGQGNGTVVENIIRFGKMKKELSVRTPVIPGVNDSPEDIRQICKLLSPYRETIRYSLLPFHTLGFGKFTSLGMTNEMNGTEALDKNRLNELKQIVSTYNLKP